MPPLTVDFQLDIDDNRLDETGFQISLTSPRSWGSRSTTDTGVFWEALTQTVMLAPLLEFDDYATASTSDWTFTDSSANWEAQPIIPGFDNGSALFHKTTSNTRVTATRNSPFGYNPFTVVGMYLYESTANDKSIVLSWGGGAFQLTLEPGKHPVITFDGRTWTIYSIPALTTNDLYWKDLRLYVYFIRGIACIWSNFMPPFAWKPPRSVWEEHTWNDGTYTHVYLVGSGAFAITAPGMFLFNAVQMVFFKSPDSSKSGIFSCPFTLPYTPTQDPTVDFSSELFGGCSATGELRNSTDTGAYETGDQSGLIKYTLTTSNASNTPILNKCIVEWPRTTAIRSGDNYSVPVLSVREERTIDPGSDTLVISVLDDGTFSNLQRIANMRASLSIGGVLRHTGYVDKPARRSEGSQSYYEFHLRDVMRKLQFAMLVSEYDADGMEVSEVIANLVKSTGVADADIDFSASSVVLPDGGDAGEPAVRFPPGTNIFDACDYLITTWLPGWRLYGRYDGKYILEMWTEGASELTFMRADNETHPASDVLVHEELQEFIDDSSLCNFLVVAGLDCDGGILRSIRTDPSSWETPGAATYVGEIRLKIMADASLINQEAVDNVSTALFTELNRIRRYYRWKGKYNTGLYPGDVVTLDGEGKVKLMDVYSEIERGLGMAEYYGEYVGAA